MTEHSPFPWRLCGEERGGCQCGQIWSPHYPVAQLIVGEWGDDLPKYPYGNVSHELAMANGYVIAAVGDMVAALVWLALYATSKDFEAGFAADRARAALRKARLLEDGK